MGFTREELQSVPIWVKLEGLDYNYWSAWGLSKIKSLIRKLQIVDKQTEKKIGLNFARLLVKVKVDTELPQKVVFHNEKENVITQKVNYDWKPKICECCKKYGHIRENAGRIKKGSKQSECKGYGGE